MADLLIFAAFALAAVWARGRLDQASTAMACFLAWRGMEEYGWIGWSVDGQQAGWYVGLALVMVALLAWWLEEQIQIPPLPPLKPALDYAALLAWGVVQQAVLLGFMAEVNPWLAVAIFAGVHLPNPVLAPVTLAGGAASVWIAGHFGAPCILFAGMAHAFLSWFLRDVLDVDMGVGRSY